MNRGTINISELRPEEQELYRKIMSGAYLQDETTGLNKQKYKRKRRLRMGIPQLLVLVWTALELAVGFIFHDQLVPGRVNGWRQAFACVIKIAVLTAGGFFN
jgi:hypothetical protein